MVAYSFKRRFIAPIRNASKTQTIRKPRPRHVRAGEDLQLYYGMRSPVCALIANARCLAVHRIRISFARIDVIAIDGKRIADKNHFARRDGFADWREMREYFLRMHDARVFDGVLIRWRLIRRNSR